MKYNIVIVLCPSKREGKAKKFPEFKDGMYLGGQTRMDAAVKIYKDNKNAQIILVGGYNENSAESDKVTHMKQFLEERCGKNINISLRPSLPCTRHNFIAIFNMWKKNKATFKKLKNTKIGLLTNFYHLPRALRFWSELVNQKEFAGIPTPLPINAESITGDSSEAYIRFIEYLFRIRSEKEGLKDIEDGQYRDDCLRKKYKDFKMIIDKQSDILLNSEDRKELKLNTGKQC